MFEKIPVPVKGQPARASWGAGVANRVNEIGAMFPSRGLARDGLTGTGFSPLPANRRDRRGGSARSPYPFDLTTETRETGGEEGETVVVHKLVRCFWMEGGILKHHEDVVLEDEEAASGFGFLAFAIELDPQQQSSGQSEGGTGVVRWFQDLAGLAAAQKDPSVYLVPLYEFKTQDEDEESEEQESEDQEEVKPFTLVTDLRFSPNVQVFDDVDEPAEEEDGQ